MSAAPVRGHWIPWIFVAGFACLFALEAGFVALAYRTAPGTVTSEPYAVGLTYDRVLEERRREAALGWTVTAGFVPSGGLAGRVSVAVTEPDGRPLAGARIRAVAERSTRFPQIVPLDLSSDGPGRVSGDVTLPLAGRWVLRLTIERDGDRLARLVDVTVLP